MDSELKKLSKEYRKLLKNSDETMDLYNHNLREHGCNSCPIFLSEFRSVPFLSRHKNCGGCKNFKLIRDDYQKVLDSKKAIDDFSKEIYGKAIFERLIRLRPSLVDRRTQKVISFFEAFGDSYLAITSNGKYKVLIALLEDSVAIYSFK